MTEIDTLLTPFALWLGLGLTKAAVLAIAVWIAVIAWHGTTDSTGCDD
jgi:cytochrome bd-type quinol oxidase subunit 2